MASLPPLRGLCSRRQHSINALLGLYHRIVLLRRQSVQSWLRQDGQVLEVLTVNETFVGGRLCQTLRSSLTWEKQALYGLLSKPNRIGYSIRHQVQKLLADDNSQLTIVGIIAEGVIRP